MKARGNYDWYETQSGGKTTYILLTEKQAKTLSNAKPATFQLGKRVVGFFRRKK
jgi:hypothetical protein